jgi:hypothetical protein
MPTPKIVETTTGYYAYHLSESGKSGQPTLCGKTNVMSTALKDLKTWNTEPTHIRSKYCKACSEAASNAGWAIHEATPTTLVF